MNTTTNPTPTSLKDVFDATRALEVEKFGHAPKRTLFGSHCVICNRSINSFSTGPRHGSYR